MASYKELISETINDIRDKVRDAAENSGVRESVKDFCNQSVDRAKTYGQIAKLTVDHNTEATELKRAYAEIGKLYFERVGIAEDESFVELFQKAQLHKDKLSEIEAQLTAAREAVIGEPVDADIDVEIVEFDDIVNATELDGTAADADAEEHKEQ